MDCNDPDLEACEAYRFSSQFNRGKHLLQFSDSDLDAGIWVFNLHISIVNFGVGQVYFKEQVTNFKIKKVIINPKLQPPPQYSSFKTPKL